MKHSVSLAVLAASLAVSLSATGAAAQTLSIGSNP